MTTLSLVRSDLTEQQMRKAAAERAARLADGRLTLEEDRLEAMMSREWVARAACRGMNTADFYPLRGVDLKGVIQVCRGCPVRAECAEFGLRTHESTHDYGVWGGTSVGDRRGWRKGTPGGQKRLEITRDIVERMIEAADLRRFGAAVA